MWTRTLAVVLLTAAATPPARPADDPKKPPTPEERAAKAEAEVKRLREELEAVRKKADQKDVASRTQIKKLQEKVDELMLDRDRLEDRIKRLKQERDAVRRKAEGEAPGIPIPLAPVPRGPIPGAVAEVPEILRGKVTHVQDKDPQTGVQGELVQISLGLDAGLRRGAVLQLERDQKYLGTVTVDTVYPKSAVGTFTPAGSKPVHRLKPDEFPKVGDTVRSMSGREKPKDEKKDPKPGDK